MAVLTCQESALIFFSSCHHRKNILVVLGKIEKRKGFHNLYITYSEHVVLPKALCQKQNTHLRDEAYSNQCCLLYTMPSTILIFFNTAFPYYQDYVCRHIHTTNTTLL